MLWGIRNLSENTRKIYSKNLRMLARESDLNDTMKVDRFVFNLNVKNTYRNALFDAYSQYCKAKDIAWNRPELKTKVYPVKIPTKENIDKVISSASMRALP